MLHTFEILYEDNHILVVTKPIGLLCQGDKSESANLLDLLKDHIKAKANKAGNVFLALVHRLDRNTGGVIVYAKTSKAAARLSQQFRDHSVTKTYLAAIEQPPNPPTGEMIDYLKKDSKLRKAFVVSQQTTDAKIAKLNYKTVGQIQKSKSKPPLVIVEVDLLTGRFHQIRAQFAKRQLPLAGDTKYGSTLRLPAPALWANQLSFDHPTTKERLIFTAKLPNNWPF
ncbi:MAG: RluA family pseudouridine synthase [Leptonema sp. (in: Bacteria)]|nr:RluA family pseudouridine synthase [Leptonema sp. (in: bacteria)]